MEKALAIMVLFMVLLFFGAMIECFYNTEKEDKRWKLYSKDGGSDNRRTRLM